MRFSIIVPVYNCQNYLRDCLESLSKQTFRDFEVIVVDDGSSDDSGNIADSFARMYDKINVIHCSNRGPYLARRLAISQAIGAYVVFLDADDGLRRDALEIISHYIDETPADIISFRYSSKPDYSTKEDEPYLQPGYYAGSSYNLFKEAICLGRSNSLWGKAIRIGCIDIDDNQGAYEHFLMAEDLFQLIPIVDTARSLLRVEDSLYYYRPNESGSTSNYKQIYISDTDRVADRLLKYGVRWGMKECAVTGALRLYVNLTKMLVDSVSTLGLDCANAEFKLERASLIKLAPNIMTDIKRLRPDYRLLLSAVMSGNFILVRLITLMSHLCHMSLDLCNQKSK